MAESTINVVYPDMSRQSINVNINTTTVGNLMSNVNRNGKKYNLFCSYNNGSYMNPLSDDDDDILLANTCMVTESAGAPRAGGTTYTIYAKSLDAGYMMQGTRSMGGRRKSKKSRKSRKSKKSRKSRKSRR